MKRNVIAMLNMKGGVGKTTLCKEISYFLSQKMDKKVLIIDVDPQGNLTQSFFEKYNYKHSYEISKDAQYKNCNATISKIFEYKSIVEGAKITDYILHLDDNLSIIPGDLNAVFFERSSGGSESENALKNFIEDYEIKEAYDYILLDCPPTFSFYTTAALLASDFYISPIHPDSYSVLGIDLLYQVVARLKAVYRDRFKTLPLDHLGVIFSNLPKTIPSGTKELMKDIQNSETLKILGVHFFEEIFRKNPAIPKSIDYFIASSNSDYSYENIHSIIKELEERIKEITISDTAKEQEV